MGRDASANARLVGGRAQGAGDCQLHVSDGNSQLRPGQTGGETFGYALGIIVLWTSEVPPWAVHRFAQTWHLSLKKGI